MEPDQPTPEQTVTMFEEPGNAFLEPVPPLVPEPVIQAYVRTRTAGGADEPDPPT
jgi:hypothetical protein